MLSKRMQTKIIKEPLKEARDITKAASVFFSQFNKNIEDKVKYINKKPLAATSIGQFILQF